MNFRFCNKKLINQQLENKGILVKTGVLVDVSATNSPRKSKEKKEYEAVEDCKENDSQDENKVDKRKNKTRS